MLLMRMREQSAGPGALKHATCLLSSSPGLAPQRDLELPGFGACGFAAVRA